MPIFFSHDRLREEVGQVDLLFCALFCIRHYSRYFFDDSCLGGRRGRDILQSYHEIIVIRAVFIVRAIRDGNNDYLLEDFGLNFELYLIQLILLNVVHFHSGFWKISTFICRDGRLPILGASQPDMHGLSYQLML
ncbi:MAG: hypothetical protein ACXADX_05845, partial [Candidatus Hodarchaeales archaeon]